jgi:hypothetical protein
MEPIISVCLGGVRELEISREQIEPWTPGCMKISALTQPLHHAGHWREMLQYFTTDPNLTLPLPHNPAQYRYHRVP